jgi:Domain of Unknown Function (DUF1080)/FG-GAP-like repeat/FG-GAP repeat
MRRRTTGVSLTAIAAAALSIGLSGQAPATFVPDWTFKGSALTGTQQVGQATWRAENGEIIGTPTGPDGGWLLLDKGYQDVQVAAHFRCPAGCTAGVMVRSEKGADGTKGVYTVISGDERGTAAVTVDAQGKIAAREPLVRGGGSMVRFAPAPPPPGAEGRGRAGGGGGGGRGAAGRGGPGASAFVSMFTPPDTSYKPNDWNRVEVLVDVDVFRANVNGRGSAVAIDGATGTYGPVALHVAGTGEARFKDVSIKDLSRRTTPAEQVGPRFRAQHFEDFYYGWSAAAGDFNHDGVLDVTMGNRYYLGPAFTESREVYGAQAFNPAKEYTPAMVNFAFDYTADGWDDILVVESRTPVLYVNPKGESRRWTRYQVFTTPVTSESIMFKDVNADGKPDAIYSGGGTVQWVGVDTANPTGPWKTSIVSQPGVPTSIHGIGGGDVNGDGKVDIIAPHGWWEQPAAGATQVPWTFHQGAFGRNGNAGANMEAYDVNGDKLPDIVTSLAAHGFGLAWYEQKRDAGGKISFVEHLIMNDFASKNAGGVTFTELHALAIADIDGDGIQDIVTGKRHWAHLDSYSDADAHGAPVLYWYRTVRNPKAPGGAEFVPELIHNRSGVGSMIQVADLNKDGALDIMAATNRGGHIFWNTPGGARRGGRGQQR